MTADTLVTVPKVPDREALKRDKALREANEISDEDIANDS